MQINQILFGFLIGVVLVYFAKAGPILLALVTLTILFVNLKIEQNFLRSPSMFVKHISHYPAYICLALIPVWGFCSTLWSLNGPQTLSAAIKFTGLLSLVYLSGYSLRHFTMNQLERGLSLFGFTYSIALVLYVLELFTGSFLFHAYYDWKQVEIPYLSNNVHKMSAMVFVILFWPWAHYFMNKKHYVFVSFFWLLVGVCTYKANASTALIAHSCSIFFYAGFWFLPKLKNWILAYVFPSIMLTFPMINHYVFSSDNFQFASTPSTILYSFFARLKFWEFVNGKIFEKPLIGWGMASSKGFPGSDQEIASGIVSMSLHPHNNILQVWLELGGIGVLLFALSAFLLFRKNNGLSRSLNAAQGTTCFCIITFAFISFSVWHSFWIAWICITALAIIMLSKHEKLREYPL